MSRDNDVHTNILLVRNKTFYWYVIYIIYWSEYHWASLKIWNAQCHAQSNHYNINKNDEVNGTGSYIREHIQSYYVK